MFEAVLTLCLALSGDPCRDDVLLPGYEATTEAQCREALAQRPPDLSTLAPMGTLSEPRCVPQGAALTVEEVAPGVFVHVGRIEEPSPDNRGDVTNLGFVIGDNGVAVIDSGTARWMGEALWRAIRARTDLPVSHVILTHMHPDHVFGASALTFAGAQVVGHEGLARALADRRETYLANLSRLVTPQVFAGTEIARVDRGVSETAQIDLGGRVLALRAWPPAHTGTDLTVLDSRTGTLFAGDLVFDDHAPALDGSLRGWQQVLADLEALGASYIVPGHGGPVLPGAGGTADMRRYLDVLARDARTAIDAGERLGEAVTHIAAEEADKWRLFDAYNPRNATVAFTELEWE